MKKRIILLLGLSILFFGACTTPTESAEPEAPPAVEPAEPPAEATEVSEPTTAPDPTEAPAEAMEPAQPFELNSAAFAQGEPIPVQYSCNGEDISPSLSWGNPPDGTQSLTLIMDDPDAPGGTWDHWIVLDIPASVHELPEAIPTDLKFGDAAPIYGKNSWGRNDYGGPCPPSGTHRYFFKLYALDTTLNLDEGADQSQVLAAMDGHILAETELMGTFTH